MISTKEKTSHEVSRGEQLETGWWTRFGILKAEIVWAKIRERWAKMREHKGEILWAVVFAVLVPIALEVPHWLGCRPPESYKVYLMQYKWSDNNLESGANNELFGRAATEFNRTHYQVRGVPVQLQQEQINNEDESRDIQLTVAKAEEIGAKEDTLLVITQLNSGPTEAALPAFFEHTHPAVPVLATSETDDDLLKSCGPTHCGGDLGFAPLLQLPPTNRAQAEAAFRFALQNNRTRFSIVKEDTALNGNDPYVESLISDFVDVIQRGRNYDIHQGMTTSLELTPPDAQALSDFKKSDLEKDVDCVLYVGQLTHAKELLQDLSKKGSHAMVILSDTAVEPTITGGEVGPCATPLAKEACSVRFLDVRNADDWNRQTNSFVLDAQAIAGQLIDDLDHRTHSWSWFGLKCWLDWETTADVREELLREMKDDLDRRVSYNGWTNTSLDYSGGLDADAPIYTFRWQNQENQAGGNRSPHRVQGMFHVWQPGVINGPDGLVAMDDVDRWHPFLPPHPEQTAMSKGRRN
jgi:hypothetical protein